MSDFWKTGFKVEDFEAIGAPHRLSGAIGPTSRDIVTRANEILFAELEKAPKVHGQFDFGAVTMPFGGVRMSGDTHRAKLVAIEEME